MVVGIDIETTGLYPTRDHITAVGMSSSEGTFVYFVETPEKEKDTLTLLEEILSSSKMIVTWRPFDSRFIKTRSLIHRVRNPLKGIEVLDLHEVVVNNFRFQDRDDGVHLSDVAECLGFNDREIMSEEMPHLYNKWLKTEDETVRDEIINHCKKDLKMTMKLYDLIQEKNMVNLEG